MAGAYWTEERVRGLLERAGDQPDLPRPPARDRSGQEPPPKGKARIVLPGPDGNRLSRKSEV